MKLVVLSDSHWMWNDICVVEGLCIAGVPHTPTFMDWAFMADDDQIERYMSCINNNVDIILSHGPAYAIHDLVSNGGNNGDPNVGSKTLNRILQKLSPNKKRYMFHGHIHGYKDSIRHTVFNNIEIYNVSVADEDYKVVHKPLVLQI